MEHGQWKIFHLAKRQLDVSGFFCLKYNADGSLEINKARLVALGNNQQ